MKALFLGQDDNLVRVLHAHEQVTLVGVVAEERTDIDRRFFGSAMGFAEANGIPVLSPEKFHSMDAPFNGAEFALSQGYGQRVPGRVIRQFTKGIVNFHQSLLPDLGGRHPMNWAIVRGDDRTGVTFHYMDEGFDTARFFDRKRVAIPETATIMDVYHATIKCGVRLLPEVMDSVLRGDAGTPQQGEAAYYPPRTFEDGEILSTLMRRQVKDLIRALVFPYPGAWVRMDGELVVVDEVRDAEARETGRIYLEQTDGLLEIVRTREDDA